MTSTVTTGGTRGGDPGSILDPKPGAKKLAAVKMERGEFANEAFIDFTQPANRAAMVEALAQVKGKFGREYPLTIGGERVFTVAKTQSLNPSQPDQVIGVFQKATVEMANTAVEKAAAAFERWKRVPVEERVACLYRAADILRARRYELDAWLCYEIGKTWPEADADVAELIDFCEYYGREALRLGAPQKLVPYRGEKNYMKYIPLGVGVIIPPWNFAAAIMGGMTMAAVVTGNTAIVKPSSESPTIAAIFVEILYEAGVPTDVISFFHRAGEHGGRGAGDECEDAFYCVYRIEGSGAADRGAGDEDAAGAGVDQAHRAGDGRQGRDYRRRRSGRGRGGGRRGAVGVWVSGAEMLGVFAGDCF